MSAADLLAQGNKAYVSGDLASAEKMYSLATEGPFSKERCDACVNLASVMLDSGGDAEEAARLYKSALESAAEEGEYFHVDAAHNLASLLQGLGGQERTREAALLLRDVVRFDDGRWDAWANLGSAMMDSGAPKLDAIKCFQRGIQAAEAVERDESADAGLVAGVRDALGGMYYGMGACFADMDEVQRMETYQDGEVLLTAYDPSIDLNAGGQADADAAIHESAANALRAALQLRNGDYPLASHALEALSARSGGAAPDRASPAFVRALFDDFAETFDEQLVDVLDYRAPEILAAAAAERVARKGAPYASAFDAGCGTGLLGPPLRPSVGTLVGADLSGNMVDKATELGVYDALVVGDLNDAAFYAAPEVAAAAPYDLVAAADVLCYFGALETVLGLWAAALADDGDVIFSCERLGDDAGDGWALGASGRYAHRPDYVVGAAAAAGLELVSSEDIVPRVENGKDVPGTLYVLQKKGR